MVAVRFCRFFIIRVVSLSLFLKCSDSLIIHGLICLKFEDENKISPYFIAASLEFMFIADIVLKTTNYHNPCLSIFKVEYKF